MPSSGERRLRLLFLLPHVPALEAHAGGARSTAHLIAGLSRDHDVGVLCLRRSHDSPVDAVLRQRCALFDVVETNAAARCAAEPVFRTRYRLSPLMRTPRWVLSTEVPAFRARVRTMLSEWRPDIVHLGYHVMAQYAAELAACAAPRVLTMYEPGTAAAADRTRAARGAARVRAWLEGHAWARYERRALRTVDVIVALTERDRQALVPLARGKPVVRIPLGVEIPARPLTPGGASPAQVLFIGNFRHRPNVDAALRLTHAIFPMVKSARPDARLRIVGPGAPDAVRENLGSGVAVIGVVDSAFEELDRAAVVVAPLQHGGGMRVKVMEALAAGKAVVASPLAAEGLDVTHGRHVLLADADEDFARAVVHLLENPAARTVLATHAREWAVVNLGWERPVAAYNHLHERLLMPGAQASAAGLEWPQLAADTTYRMETPTCASVSGE